MKGSLIANKTEKYCFCKTLIQRDFQSLLTNNQAIKMYEKYKKNNKNNKKISIKKTNKTFNTPHKLPQNSNKEQIKQKLTSIQFKNQKYHPLRTQRAITYDQFRYGIEESEKQSLFQYSHKNQQNKSQKQRQSALKTTDSTFFPIYLKQNQKKSINTFDQTNTLKKIRKSMTVASLSKNKSKKDDPQHWLFGDNKINIASRQSIKDLQKNNNFCLPHKLPFEDTKSLNERKISQAKISQNRKSNQTNITYKTNENNLITEVIHQEEQNSLYINSPINKINNFENQRFFPSKPKSSKVSSFFEIDDLPEKTNTQNTINSIRIKEKNSIKNNLKKLFDSDLFQYQTELKDPSQPKLKQSNEQEKQYENHRKEELQSNILDRPLNFYYSVNLKRNQCNKKLTNMIKKAVQSIQQEYDQNEQQKQMSQVLSKFKQYYKMQIKESVQNLTLLNKIEIKQLFNCSTEQNFDLSKLKFSKSKSSRVFTSNLILN